MGKRGLSYDEKRAKMLEYFHKTVKPELSQKEAFNLKEIEKFSVKLGLPLPTVKEILDSLVGDDLVVCEKIGAGNFFWSFPSQAYQTIQNKLEGVQADILKIDQEIEDLEEKQKEKLVGKEVTENRDELNEKISELKKEIESKEKNLAVYMKNDPSRLKELGKSLVNKRTNC